MNGKDFERFDQPTYSGEEISFEEEGALAKIKPITNALKKNIKLIIVLIVLVVIAFFAFDFFILSIKNVSITIKNTEGQALDDSTLRILGSDGKQIFREQGKATYTTQLKVGEYNYEATATGYELKKDSLSITRETVEAVIVLQKNIKAEILDFKENFPSKLFVGQSTEITVQVKNNGKTAQEIALVFEDDFEKLRMEAIPSSLTVLPESSSTATISINVPSSLQIEDEKEGDSFSGTIRIKYTNIKEKKDFTVFQAPEIEFDAVDFATLDAGKTKEKEIKIENNSKFAVSDLTLSIAITNATKNNPENVLQWFKFTAIADQPNPQSIQIDSIGAREDITINLRVDVPLTAKSETINGNIILSSSYFNSLKPLTLTVGKEAEYSLDIEIHRVPKISWLEDVGYYEEQEGSFITIENNGRITLENIVLTVKNNTVCTRSWLKIIDEKTDRLVPREENDILVHATAPAYVHDMPPEHKTMQCRLHYRFDNPLGTSPLYIEGDWPEYLEIEAE